MSEVNIPTPQRRGLQFSLRTAFLLVVLVAAGVSLLVSYRQAKENRRLHEENARLRNETGQLTIEPGDNEKVNAIKLMPLESATWKWRVYVPPGRHFVLREKASGPYGGGGSSDILQSGESAITAALRRNQQGQWEWIVQHNDDAAFELHHPLPSLNADYEHLLFEDDTSVPLNNYQRTVSVDEGKHLELLNLKISTDSKVNGGFGPDVSESIRIVIEEGVP